MGKYSIFSLWVSIVVLRRRAAAALLKLPSIPQVSECNWQVRRAPNLRSLYSVCKNMHLWLKQDQRNICIVHCLVGAPLWPNQEV